MDEWEQEGLNLRKKLRERLDQTREVEDQEIYRQIDDLILEETRNRIVRIAAENIRALLEGGEFCSEVDFRTGYRKFRG